MIVAKFILLFSPLLLLANAQGGGRLGFFSRPDFRRPRPWERPTVAPVPETQMPTEKATEHITDSPRASTELPTFIPVKSTSEAPVSSVSRFSQRGRVWARPVFQGSRPIATSTPAAITPRDTITLKADGYSPAVSIVSSTTKPDVYIITPSSIGNPFGDNQALYKDPNNFNSRGRYVPKITHNNDEIPSDLTKTSTKLPLTTEKIVELITEKTTIPTENHSPMVSSTSTTTESMTYTTGPTSVIPFINNPTTELRTTPTPSTSPRVTFIPTRSSDYDSRTGLPLYMSHNNVPGIQPQYTSGDYLNPSSTTIAAITELPSSTTESAGFKVPTSPKIPFVDYHERYNDIYSTTNTPIPFKIVSTADEASATTSRPIYQVNQNNKNSVASNYEIGFTTPKAVTTPTIEKKEYIIMATTESPNIDVHKQYDNGFTSHFTVEYGNGYEKSSEEQSKSDGNAPIYPVYHHETEKVSHYEQSSLSTRKPEGYTVATSKIPFMDSHQLYNGGFTSGPAVEYTNGHEKTTEIPTSKIPADDSRKFIQNIYPNHNHKVEYTNGHEKTTEIPTSKIPADDSREFIQNIYPNHNHKVEYTNGNEKTTEIPTSKIPADDSREFIQNIYPNHNHKVEYTNGHEKTTEIPTSKIPADDSREFIQNIYPNHNHKVEYTNGNEKTTEIPTSKIPADDSREFIQNIYPNHNHKGNDYEYSLAPKTVTTTQSSYQYRTPKTTTEKPVVTQTVRQTSYRYTDMTTKPTARYTTTTTTTTVRPSRLRNVYDIENFKCKEQDAYYSITNQCDDFIECKSGYPIQNTCPDGLHFNPAVKYGEFPCAFPSEVKCDINSVIRQAEPTSSCPRRYGYFAMQDGRCDKYLMCQEGQATIMSCPAGLAFSVATSSCDWPSNVPDCLPDVFQGFTCPAPEFNEDGEPSIIKYRYDKSCKKYIVCQKGHPRLLSCDAGLAFDENSESCVDEFEVTNCT